ncbi:tRNA-dihydrouridine synthase [Marinimicrobium sp. ABcell2]|uniref:tRNA dihydrouridine synthase n=1 Tax=Marinimicrobium sp. ABcell2 TaxID=3069751 RepID=UPI0027B329D6|nr:tRNA-dihydrouridine synthase [Marinimicrobium sp. ABcell2]MDQ2078499.1 tRNA-dihydrouridine synthase [Marinimicrobium sp. ABcell2]
MKLYLAPMEGVVDHQVRALLTALGGLDGCVTEFVRVSAGALPRRVFRRYAPELEHQCQTPSGVPVKVQLLGGNPELMALNARRAVRAGAMAIDLNFGCPAKTVNKSDGGACLLRQPERVHSIVKAVRDALPAEIPVSAKIRLGYEDRSAYLDNAHAITAAGANEVTVHARSKADGYRPPAYWEYIAEIREAIAIPVIANGEIWSWDDFERCRAVTGCDRFMLGRGLLACPDLARQVKARLSGTPVIPMAWSEVCGLLHHYYQLTQPHYPVKHCGNRIKQWLMYLRRQYPEADRFFEVIKRERAPERIEAIFQAAA